MVNSKKYTNLKRNGRPRNKKVPYENILNRVLDIADFMYKCLKTLTIGFVVIILTLNVLAPVFVYIWPNSMSHLIFQNFIHLPFKNLSNTDSFGLKTAHAFKLNHDDVVLGGWHIMPKDHEYKQSSSSLDNHFRDNIRNVTSSSMSVQPIIVLYLHGNTNDRSTQHRVELYKMLSDMNYHTVAIDYRGYGDSTGVPTEKDVVKDALFTYEYLNRLVPHAKIYIWGHSLGTGISSSLARILTEKNNMPSGVILEAPFYNIVEEVELHPFTILFSYHPILFTLIEDSLKSLDLQFRSDIHLTKVKSKIMILHAEDDRVIPIHQAEKLYEVINTTGITEKLTFHRFEYDLGCGHRNIYIAPQITNIIKSFIV